MKSLNREIEKSIKKDKQEYYNNKLNFCGNPSEAWKDTIQILGITKNLKPVMIKFKNENNTDEITRNPEKMASLFNHFFLDKVKKIREGMKDPIKIQPAERLERWLRNRELQVPEFRLNPIDISTLRKVMKRLKGKKVAGCDTIDNYSLKNGRTSH